jgi:cephalosporin hydroxylase
MTKISDDFHKYYESNRLWSKLKWFGIPMWKLPFDAFIVHNLISKIKPDYIIETGTGAGGSSYFYASICDLLDHGEVITIDIKNQNFLHSAIEKIKNRITFINCDSIELSMVLSLYNKCANKKNIVILDSWHTYDHVYKELQMYCDLVSIGSYLIVEDTHVNSHPIDWEWGQGPYEAVQDFLKTEKGKNFIIDEECENQIMTFNPGGFLKRMK